MRSRGRMNYAASLVSLFLPIEQRPSSRALVRVGAASLSHGEAREIIEEAWQKVHGRSPTSGEVAYTQAIALLETGYGRAGQFANLAARGQYNWGALERRRPAGEDCPPGTAAGTDQGQVCFFVFPDDVSAAAAFIRNLTKRHWPTIEAMRGSPEDVARAMRVSPVYYSGNPGSEESKVSAYANAIRNGLKSIGSAVPAGAKTVLPWAILAAAGAGLVYGYYQKYGTPKVLRRLGVPA